MNIRDRIKELRRVPANELRPNPKNWRTHPEKQLNAIRGVLAEVGFAGAELARELEDGTLELIDGHARAEVAGTAKVPVLVLDVNEAEANKILATFDPIGAMAESDAAKLDSVLREVETANEDLSQMLADLATDAGLYLEDVSPEIHEDEVPEPPSDPITKTGDVWTLGRHRLLCGDSFNERDIKTLMVDDAADLVFTDPPYGINVVGGAKARNGSIGGAKARNGSIKGASKVNPSVYRSVIGDDAEYDPSHIFNFFPDAKYILWGANYFHHNLPLGGRWFVWDKNRGEGTTFSDCELAWTTISGVIVKKYKVTWDGMNKEGESGRRVHPTQKPILLSQKILDDLQDQKVVVDLFAGSGSCVLACEKTQKNAKAVEIDPAYCDVIVERWQNLTGEKAKRAK